MSLFTRDLVVPWDIQPITGYAVATQSRRARWTRGEIVRQAAPAFFLPPRKIMFDITDPLTYRVKGAGYRPY